MGDRKNFAWGTDKQRSGRRPRHDHCAGRRRHAGRAFRPDPGLAAKAQGRHADLKKLEKDEEERDDGKSNNLSAEEFVRPIDKEPRAMAILARHGLGSRDYAMSTYAMMHAGMFVALEPA